VITNRVPADHQVYLTPWERSKLKNSLKSLGSSTPIVDPAEGFDVAKAFGGRAAVPVRPFVRVVEQRSERERRPVETRRGCCGFAHGGDLIWRMT